MPDSVPVEINPFVGRVAELSLLERVFDQARQGHGAVVFVEGGIGMGKSKLLSTFEAKLKINPTFSRAIFCYGYCYQDTGEHNAYQPLVEILQRFAAMTPGCRRGQDERFNFKQHIARIIKDTAPDWLQMIPGIGTFIGAGVLTAKIAAPLIFKTRHDKHVHLPETIASQYANAISEITKHSTPFAIVVEDAHWIDHASAQVLIRLAQGVTKMPVVVLITYRPEEIGVGHPLVQLRNEVRARGISEDLLLSSFSQESIKEYLTLRYSSQLEPHLAQWLHQLCHGHPLFVAQYLSLLEQQGIIALAEGEWCFKGEIEQRAGEIQLSGEIATMPIPQSVEAVLEERIERLLDSDREMLQLGSVQGEYFFSSVLAQLLDQGELQILSRLRKIVSEHRIITIHSSDDWLKQRSEVYAFEHLVMQQALYRRLGPRERLLYHRQVAGLLEQMLIGVENPPRKMLLETGRHFQQAGQLLPAAHWYYIAAQSSFRDGAFEETVQLCRQIVLWLNNKSQVSEEEDQLRVNSICMLLLALEFSWTGKRELQGDLPVNNLIEEAEISAIRLDDEALLTQVKYIKGRLLASTTGLSESMESFREALCLAQKTGDRMAEFIIRCDFGHQMVGESVSNGLSMMYEAKTLYQQHLEHSASNGTQKMLKRHFYRLRTTLGVNEFDRGDFDQALLHLLPGIAGLTELEMHDDLTRAYNFLGQVYTAMGLFEEAEASICEGIEQLREKKGANPWRAYNLGLLGKLYLEWGRYDDAREVLAAAWQETEKTWNTDLAPLVANYRAELLIHPAFKRRSPKQGRVLLERIVTETTKTQFHRSLIGALSLLAQLSLTEGEVEDSLNFNQQAVRQLETFGGLLPALRSEEVFYYHAQTLSQASKGKLAERYLGLARKIVQRKGSTISNTSHRDRFLSRVPINKLILAA